MQSQTRRFCAFPKNGAHPLENDSGVRIVQPGTEGGNEEIPLWYTLGGDDAGQDARAFHDPFRDRHRASPRAKQQGMTMRLSDAFQEGFRVINRNWQLIAVQVIAMILILIGFMFVVVLPVVITFFLLGIDLTVLTTIDALPYSFSEFVNKYFLLFAVAAAFFLFYLLLVTVITVFLFGASSGIIAESVKNPAEKFTLPRFFAAGRRLFFPMVRYLTAAGSILLLLALIIVLIFIGLFALYDSIKGSQATVGLFIGLFLVLSIIVVTLFLVTASLAAFFYGTAVLIFRENTAFASFKEATLFLYHRQNAYWLYCLLFGISILLSLLIMLAGIPLGALPIIGTFLSIPYQIFSVILQTYFSFFITASLFTYYYHVALPTGTPSTPGTYISLPEPPRHDDAPQA